jgi:hypothetical protein
VAVEDVVDRVVRDRASLIQRVAVPVLALVVRLVRVVEVAEPEPRGVVLRVGLATGLVEVDAALRDLRGLDALLERGRLGDLVVGGPSYARRGSSVGSRDAGAERPGTRLIADLEEDLWSYRIGRRFSSAATWVRFTQTLSASSDARRRATVVALSAWR